MYTVNGQLTLNIDMKSNDKNYYHMNGKSQVVF